MAKIRTIAPINIRYLDSEGKSKVASISKDSYIEVTEQKAIYFCNEDIEVLSLTEQRQNRRAKKAVRTGFFSMDNLTKPHEDYTFL